MPIYEYRCRACGFEKEYLQKHADAPIEVCERCGQAAMSKLLSAAGFQLKGSGWYATDFKGSGAKPAAKTTDAAKSDSAASTDKPAGESGTGDKAAAEKPAADKSADKAPAAKTTPASTSG